MDRRRFLLAAAAFAVPAPALAGIGAARRLVLVQAETGERFAGPIDPGALGELAHFLRDRQAGAETPIDPALPVFLADVIAAIGAREATVLSGYRTRETNAALIKRKFPAVEASLHLHGEAVDVTFPRRLADAAAAARRMKRGGVGWYPAMKFIHLDVGAVRSWTLESRAGADAPTPPNHPLTNAERQARHKALAKQQLQERKRGG